jgi:hypothetical protein
MAPPVAVGGLAGLRHRLAVAFSRGLGRVHLNEVRAVEEGGARFYLKSRRWSAALLLGPGNHYLRLLRAGVTVLDDEESAAWTRRVYSAAYGLDIPEDPPGRLKIPAAPGRALAEILGDDALPLAGKIEAAALAAAALRHLHGIEMHGEPLSHGDATASNVGCDIDAAYAQWFDFDTRHDASLPGSWRRADDLRALVASTACSLPKEAFPELSQAMIRAYPEPAVWRDLGEQIAAQAGQLNAYHLAQAPLESDARAALEAALRDAIGELGGE